jgi:hypothetical protein
MMRKYCLAVVSALCIVFLADIVHAVDYPRNFESVLRSGCDEFRSSAAEFQEGDELLATKALDVVYWNASFGDVYASLEKNFTLNGNNLAIKLGFIRGDFDSYSQTYKAKPVVALRNVDANLVFSFIRFGQRVDNGWNTAATSGRVFVGFQAQSVEVTDFYDATKSVSIPYSELVSKWSEHASAYCSWYAGKKYCLVPQTFWDGSYHQSGFVLSEGGPLYSTTSLPQDYVGLFREEPSSFTPSYRPIVYSLALRLAFVLSPNQKNVWEIRQMTTAEVGEAMVDRMSTLTLPMGTSPTIVTRESVSH